MKHEKTFAAIDKLKDVELELHRLKNALEMANRALEAKDAPASTGETLFRQFMSEAEKVGVTHLAPPQQEAKDEPVAWMYKSGSYFDGKIWHGTYAVTTSKMAAIWHDKDAKPLYTTPPQRTWVGLTNKDWNRSKHTEDFQKGVDWAEEMLKGKNT
jgi:hypothetical protein